MNKYTKQHQAMLKTTRTWEDKRRDEFAPSVAITLCAFAFVVGANAFIDSMIQWAASL